MDVVIKGVVIVATHIHARVSGRIVLSGHQCCGLRCWSCIVRHIGPLDSLLWLVCTAGTLV